MCIVKLPMLPQDKANHFIYGALIWLGVLVLALVLGCGERAALGAANVVLVAVAWLKELVDWTLNRMATAKGQAPTHGVEALDAVATMSGGALVLAVWLICRSVAT